MFVIMEERPNPTALTLSTTEYSNIDEYRRKKNTAVLTIMFTDIQGFTALTENKGETYVHELHQQHDKILVETIEEDNAGVVIKFIGDSIMAVFAEPTAAAEKALKIQLKLHTFNQEHPELADIKVRIGLHMGQTVIENKIQTDLFGRHVNKASRVESLASGGHIFISYPVFDSVKSWLIDAKNVASKLHGSYFLKGIDKAEEIYEIYNTEITRPEAPKKARKLGSKTPILAGIIVLTLLAIAALALSLNQTRLSPSTAPAQNENTAIKPAATTPAETVASAEPAARTEPAKVEKTADKETTTQETAPEVYFLGLVAREPILDFDTPLAVTLENEAQGLKKSVNDITAGKHIIHYVVSYMVRYYAEISVKPGKNVIQTVFKESYLPGIDVNYTFDGENAEPTASSNEGEYFLFDHKTLERVNYKGKVSAEVNGAKAPDGTVSFTIHYAVILDGKNIADKKMTIESPPNASDRTYADEQILYEALDHYYFLKYSYIGDSIQFSLGSSFKD